MDAISGALGRLIVLCALTALTERLALSSAVQLIGGLLAAEAMLEIILSLVALG